MMRCLIVDDSSVIRKVAKRILAGPTMITSEAGNGMLALSLCRTELPDIILVDSVLPDMPVTDFIREAMAMHSRRQPRIVVSMTQLDIGTIMRAKRAGARGYVLKPFNRAQLVDKLRAVDLAA